MACCKLLVLSSTISEPSRTSTFCNERRASNYSKGLALALCISISISSSPSSKKETIHVAGDSSCPKTNYRKLGAVINFAQSDKSWQMSQARRRGPEGVRFPSHGILGMAPVFRASFSSLSLFLPCCPVASCAHFLPLFFKLTHRQAAGQERRS